MTSKVPHEIREQVLVLWLRACSRDDIARIAGIGTGTVSQILKDYNQRNPEFVLLREFVVAVKKEGSDIKERASAIRLKRFLESHNLLGEQIESLIRIASIHCFKREVDIEKFVENVNKASDLANKTGVAVEKLPGHIQEMERELYSVTMDLMSKTAKRDAVSREYDDKKVQLEDLNKNIANTQTIKGMQYIDALEKEKENLVRNRDYAISQWLWERFCRNLLADELAKANKKIYGNSDQSKNHQSTATRSARAKGTMN
jgi:transcriptional regulator with XRE-family HTH domain